MFIQVIQGRTRDREGMRRQMERWSADLQPDATGFLGATAGATADGRAILIARFESKEAAMANSGRPEQDTWWNETEKTFDGPVTFHESEDVEELQGGGSDDAGFVQIMQGRAADRAALADFERRFEARLAELHPALIGSVRCWYGDGEYTDVAYFTSEAEARDGERALGEAPDAAAAMEEFQRLAPQPDFFDLTEPVLVSG